MASLDVIALDPVTPQLRAPGVGDTYHFCRVVEFQDGTDAAPSITNVGDANTGIYWPNADELAVSTGGVQRMSLGATTVFNETGADVDFRVEGDTNANLLFVDASTDRVAVGTNTPLANFQVVGSQSGTDETNATAFFGGVSSGTVYMYFGINDVGNYGYIGTNEIGAGYRNLSLSPNGGNVGIGTASPAFKLDVAGTGKVSALYLTDMTAGAGALYYNTGAENRLTLANYNVGGTIFFETNGGTYAGAIDASQNWGIGTTTPNVRLDVAGAMRLRGSTSGYVGLQAAAVAGTTTYTLPSADGSNGQVLTTNGTGTLSWTTNAGGDVTGPASASDNAIARFDGTTGKLIQNSAVFVDDDGDVGIGTSTPGEKLQIESGTPRIYINATTNSASAGMYARVKDGSGNADFSGILFEPTANIANRYINFTASNIGSDMAIVAGGNVGIGTTSPDAKLSVNGVGSFGAGTAALPSVAQFGDLDTGRWSPAANTLAWSTGGSERMRLNSSGNLGLGVTPSAWGTAGSRKAIQLGFLGGGSVFTSGSGNTLSAFVHGAYENGTSWLYAESSIGAGRYEITGANAGSTHAWYNSAGGVAGNTISFTQAMTLNASGNLGIGTTSPLNRLHVDSGATASTGFFVSTATTAYDPTTSASVLNSRFILRGGSATNSYNAIRFTNTGSCENFFGAVQNASGVGQFVWGGYNGSAYAEWMRLDSSGNLGIGTSSPSSFSGYTTVSVNNATNGGIYNILVNGTETARLQAFSGAFTVAAKGASTNLLFETNGSERARIDTSGNVGIGTSSPTQLLHVRKDQAAYTWGRFDNQSSSASAYAGVQLGAFGNTWGLVIGSSAATSNALQFVLDAGGTNAEKMRLDTSGNLGLGVTPSAWGNGVSMQGAGWALSTTLGTDCGAYYVNARQTAYANIGSSCVYRTTAPAGAYGIESATHKWYTAPSGTAGNAISFTQAMTLDASGNLLLGITSSDGSRLRVYGAYQTLGDGAYEGLIGKASSLVSGGAAGDFAVRSAASMLFATNGNTERARITSGGDLLVGTTSTNGKFTVLTDSASVIAGSFENSAATPTAAGLLVNLSNATGTNNGTAVLYRGRSAGGDRFYVYGNGNVVNTNGSYGTISDAKMKADIVDAGSQWDDIKAVRFRKFKMKDDPTGLVQLGVVAQELEQTSPGLVNEHADRDAKGNDLGTTTKSVKTSVLLIKAAVALQEAMARIEQLEAKVAALEAE